MFVRYIAEREETQQGLLTLIPFIERMEMTKKDAQLLNKIDCHIEKNLPYPVTEDGKDVYAANSVLTAWFTEEGEREFGEDMRKLAALVDKYGEPFDYTAKRITTEDVGEYVYKDNLQIIAK